MKLSQEYLEYSDNSEKLSEILEGVVIYLDGSHIVYEEVPERRMCGGKVYETIKKLGRRVWNVRVERKGKSIKFNFHNSISEFQAEEKTVEDWGGKMNKTGKQKNDRYAGVVEKAFRGEDLAYSILCSMGSDGCMDMSSFENWCSEFGHDTDSRKAFALYMECQEQVDKILKLFSTEELSCFPR